MRVLYDTGAGAIDPGPFTRAAGERALRFHKSLPSYRETPLVSLDAAARRYGVGGIFVKDESQRFGLKAFKGLGGSWAVFRILCERLSLDPDKAAFDDVRKKSGSVVFATATDGNHGRGVSWAAGLFGCSARVYMPAGSSEARRRAIELAGNATAEITPFPYDETVACAADLARKNGYVLLQDTSWEGYEAYPRRIIEGYLTMASEAVRQLGEHRPTHVFLQAGVGAMAGGAAAYLKDVYGDDCPRVAVVEPEAAACLYLSKKAGDGRPHSLGGAPETIMAGLNCGTPCSITWPILCGGASFFCACRDSVAERGMRAYASPAGGDAPVVSGESGAVTYGALLTILENDSLRELFGITEKSSFLLFSTEGDTDPESYTRIVGVR